MLEQVTNLLIVWKAQLRKEYGPDGLPIDKSPAFAAARIARRKCIDELEAVLTGKPLPEGEHDTA